MMECGKLSFMSALWLAVQIVWHRIRVFGWDCYKPSGEEWLEMRRLCVETEEDIRSIVFRAGLPCFIQACYERYFREEAAPESLEAVAELYRIEFGFTDNFNFSELRVLAITHGLALRVYMDFHQWNEALAWPAEELVELFVRDYMSHGRETYDRDDLQAIVYSYVLELDSGATEETT